MINDINKLLKKLGYKEEKKIVPECEEDNLENIKLKSLLKFVVTKKQGGFQYGK